MSAAHTGAALETWPQLEREVRAGKLTMTEFEKKLSQLTEPAPAPLGSDAPAPKGGALGAIEKGIDSASNPFNLTAGLAGDATKAAGELVSQSASDLGIPTPESIAKGVVTDVVEAARPEATRVGLYAVLILGAVAMMVFGFSELLKPVGGPDLAGKAKSAGKVALVGAEA